MRTLILLLMVGFSLGSEARSSYGTEALDPSSGRIVLYPTDRGETPCPTPGPCSTYPTTGLIGHAYDVYVLATAYDTSGIGGASLGIRYDEVPGAGLDIYSWTLCANADAPVSGPYGPWPAPRSGNRILWSSCPRGPIYEDDGIHAVAGSFYVYAYSNDMLVLLNDDVPLEVVDCKSVGRPISENDCGCVKFSSGNSGFDFGFNPCASSHPHGDPGQYSPTVLLHVQDTAFPVPCFTEIPTNSGIVTHMEVVNPDAGTEYFVYVLVGDKTILESKAFLAGAKWGIDYTPHTGPGQGLEVLEWHGCGIETPTQNWPAPGSGNSMVWDLDVHECRGDRLDGQLSKFTTLGYFRVAAYGPSTFSIVPHPASGKVLVADCSGYGYFGICEAYRPVDFDSAWTIIPSLTGWVSFGDAGPGCNPQLGPCGLALNQSTTWGRVKTKYLK